MNSDHTHRNLIKTTWLFAMAAALLMMTVALIITNSARQREWIRENYPPQDLLDRVEAMESKVFANEP